jgi:hypothetical protein
LKILSQHGRIEQQPGRREEEEVPFCVVPPNPDAMGAKAVCGRLTSQELEALRWQGISRPADCEFSLNNLFVVELGIRYTLTTKPMKTFAWLLKNVVLPLAPFLVGALVRFLHSGQFSWQCLSATELAFSMAMMFLILTASTSRLQNHTLKEALNSGFDLGVVVFLALFAIALFLEVDALGSLQDFLATATARINNSRPLLLTDLPERITREHGILERIRFTTLILSGISISLAVWVGKQYELMDA